MAVTRKDVRYIAELARLRFTEEEEIKMAEEMNQILVYMEKLNALDTSNVPPMSHVLDISDVFRPDEPQIRITREEALKNAPDTDGEYFRVPKVIE